MALVLAKNCAILAARAGSAALAAAGTEKQQENKKRLIRQQENKKRLTRQQENIKRLVKQQESKGKKNHETSSDHRRLMKQQGKKTPQ